MVRVYMGCFAALILGATAMACTATPSVVDEPAPEDNVAPPDDSKPTDPPPPVKPEPPDACAKEVECPTEAPKQGDACPCLSKTACSYDGTCKDVPFPDFPSAVYANCDGKQWVVEPGACPPSDQ